VTVPPGALSVATTRADRGPPRIRRAAPRLQNPNVQNSERLHEEGCWSHPWVHNLSWGGPGGHYRYPEDRIPPRRSSKSKLKDKTDAHARVSRGFCLLAQSSSGATTCLVTPAPATRACGSSRSVTCPVASTPVFGHRTAPGLPCAPWLQFPPPGPEAAPGLSRALCSRLLSPSTGQLRDRHVPRGESCELQVVGY
jgi:hypothetical protein